MGNNISTGMRFLLVTVCFSVFIPILSMALAMRQGVTVDEEEYEEVEVDTRTDTTEKHLALKATEQKDHPNPYEINTKKTNYHKTEYTKADIEYSEEVMKKDDDEPVIRAWEQMSYIAFQVWAKLNSIADGQKVVLALCISTLALVTLMVCILIIFTICKLRKCYINKYQKI